MIVSLSAAGRLTEHKQDKEISIMSLENLDNLQ